MTARAHDPRKLDVAAAAAEGAVLCGRCPVAALDRLADGAPASDALDEVTWEARFERRAVRGGPPEARLALKARARVWRECQRCLQPVVLALSVDRSLRIVADEATAAELDADSEEDVLAAGRRFDLLALVEDELLLALPLVAMHDTCPNPLCVPAAGPPDATTADGPVHPFAALARLKRGGSA